MQDCHYHMWHIGVMSDAQVVARYGVGGLDTFRSNIAAVDQRDDCSGSSVTAVDEAEIGEDNDLEVH